MKIKKKFQDSSKDKKKDSTYLPNKNTFPDSYNELKEVVKNFYL